MKVRKELQFCPDCGAPLVESYDTEDNYGNPITVYSCVESGEDYYFEENNGYIYSICLYDGQKMCVWCAGVTDIVDTSFSESWGE